MIPASHGGMRRGEGGGDYLGDDLEEDSHTFTYLKGENKSKKIIGDGHGSPSRGLMGQSGGHK